MFPDWRILLILSGKRRCDWLQPRGVCWTSAGRLVGFPSADTMYVCAVCRGRGSSKCVSVSMCAPRLCVSLYVRAPCCRVPAFHQPSLVSMATIHQSRAGEQRSPACPSLSQAAIWLLVFFLIECDLWDIGLRPTLSLNQRTQQWGSKINHESTEATRRGYDRSLIKDWTLSTLAQIFFKLY